VIVDFKSSAVVRVPATSANLGPGFDSYGLALAIYDELEVTVVESGRRIEVVGEGHDSVALDESNLVWRSMRRFFEVVGARPPGAYLTCRNGIPHGRGLGSSAAAIVGGLALARELVVDSGIDDQRLLELATEMEGHPDNVAAALLGGFTVAWTDAQSVPSVGALRMDPHPDLRAVVMIPMQALSTKRARSALPEAVPHCDAATNVARAGLLVEALTRRPEYLLPATYDRLHQLQRREAYPASYAAVELLRDAGLAAVVSGAGPSVLVLGADELASRVRDLLGADLDVREVALDLTGVTVLPGGVLR